MRNAVLSLAALTVLATTVGAQAKPDFSGTWKRNAEKSDPMGGGMGGGGGGGAGAAMATATTVITQTADKLTLEIKMGEMSRSLAYTLDGKESVNPGMRGGEMKSIAKWDGANLVIESTAVMGERTINSKEVRSLSADGKTMTVTTTRPGQDGTERTTKAVYDKQ
jgi:hypothetical protein